MSRPSCEWCGGEIPAQAVNPAPLFAKARRRRQDSKFCGKGCRQASWRAARRIALEWPVDPAREARAEVLERVFVLAVLEAARTSLDAELLALMCACGHRLGEHTLDTAGDRPRLVCCGPRGCACRSFRLEEAGHGK